MRSNAPLHISATKSPTGSAKAGKGGKPGKPGKPKKPGQPGTSGQPGAKGFRPQPHSHSHSHEPVEDLEIDTNGEYNKRVWCTICLGFVNILIGAVNMSAIMFSVYFEDAHVTFCTVSYHFFCAEAILSLNYANGWSTPMRLRHRKFIHVFLQICGMGMAITGTMLVVLTKGISGSAHGITGIAAAIFSGFSLLSGPCSLFGGRYLKIIHMTLGMPTFIMSSVSLCLGCFTTSFHAWAGTAIVLLIVAFVSFYTIFIVVTVFMKCVSQI